MSNYVKKICLLGVGIALYVVLGMMVKIPLIGHIQTDLGYVAFGTWLVMFGWPAAVVGVIGCFFESLLISGWVPIGWMIGQTFIGIVCGCFYNKGKANIKKHILMILITIVSVFIGIAIIKTVVECKLYSIPFQIKFAKNSIAFVADTVPMIIGYFVGERIKKVRI